MSRFATILICIMVSSCTAQLETFVAETPAEGWCDGVKIEIKSDDTISLYNLSLFTRTRNTLINNNFKIEIMTSTPDSITYSDTISIEMLQGEKICETPYRKDSRWSRIGLYTIRITPIEMVNGVEAIGIKRVK